MNRLSGIVIVLLSAAVVLLGAALLSRQTGAPEAGAPSESRETATATPDGSSGETADLNCTVQSGALQIIRGEAFGISEGADACEATFADGVYTVTAFGTGEPVVVTVPQEMTFSRITLSSTGGSLDAEDLDTEELSVSCGQGTLRFSGSVTSGAEVEHTQGETSLELDGDPAAFNYDLSYEMGHIQVGEQSYAGSYGSQSIDNGSEKTIRVHCSMGSVDISFSAA